LLAEHLRATYDEVVPGYHLNKKHWNTIIISGQLSEQEVLDLVELSYQLVLSSLPAKEQEHLKPSQD
jgi:predicted DNA-binding protein (MmcQ/YjbR family)